MSKILSVIISNRNDTVMLNLTIRSCIEEFRSIGIKRCEIIICDNSDLPFVPVVHTMIPEKYIEEGTVKLIYQQFPCLFTAREEAAKAASGTYIFCLDSHMLSGADTIYDTLKFAESKASDKTFGFAHPPISWAHQHESAARHDRDMKNTVLGGWNKLYTTNRPMTWKGMPWLCRRDWFLDNDKGLNAYGALSQHRLSWGGGDMHIGMKPWMLGFKNWSVATNPYMHIGPYPAIEGINKKVVIRAADGKVKKNSLDVGYAYRTYRSSGDYNNCLGYLTSCYVLGGEQLMQKAIPELTGLHRALKQNKIDDNWDLAKKFGADEKAWLDERKTIRYIKLIKSQPWNEIV